MTCGLVVSDEITRRDHIGQEVDSSACRASQSVALPTRAVGCLAKAVTHPAGFAWPRLPSRTSRWWRKDELGVQDLCHHHGCRPHLQVNRSRGAASAVL